MKKVTLSDVAAYSGVSRATISRVLNNNPQVAPELRARVLEAVQALGYQPNRAARRLRADSSDILGLIIPDIENPFYISAIRGIQDLASENQMSLLLCNTDEDPAKQQMYLSVMEAEQVAGLIIAPTHVHDGEVLRKFTQSDIPVILIDRRVDCQDFDAVTVDNVSGAYAAVKHLIDNGYTRIAMIGGSPVLSISHERFQGYKDAHAHAGIKMEKMLAKEGGFDAGSGYQLTRELLLSSRRPQAIFAANNLITLGVLRAIRELGLVIPDDIAIVAFDDMPWFSELRPPLTAVSQPTYELGQEAVRLLLRRLDEPDAPFRNVVLQARLIVRESSGRRSA
jgi:LacI family transcriptional regulator